MSGSNGGSATGGQAPAGDGANAGQAPQANNNGSGNPATAGQAGQAPNGNTQQSSQSGQQFTQADYERIIADLRKENAGHRTENARVAAELKKFQDAQLSDTEKAAKRLAELEQTNTTQARELTELRLTRAIERQAATLNIIDPDAAVKLLDWAEIDFDASGAPKNLDKLLAALIAAKPWLVGTQQPGQPGQRPAASSGGATNPGAGSRAGTFTREQIAKMTPREYEQNRAAIMESLKQGVIRP